MRVPARPGYRPPLRWPEVPTDRFTLFHPPLLYCCHPLPSLRYTLPSRPAYMSPPGVLATPAAPCDPVRVTAPAPPLPCVARVVAPVTLLVTREVVAH